MNTIIFFTLTFDSSDTKILRIRPDMHDNSDYSIKNAKSSLQQHALKIGSHKLF